MKKALALFLLPALAHAATPASPVTAAEKTAAQAITENAIRGHVRFLASDLLEGRAPASRGDRLAQQYVQAQMEAIGLQPGAPDGGWLQKVSLVGITGRIPEKLSVAKGGQAVDLKRMDDFVAFSGTQKPESRIDKAEIVFVGYGIVAPEFQWDDYKDVDVKGKVLLMMNNDPEDDPKLFAGETRLWYGRWDYKYSIAAQKGAVGAFIIHTQPSAGYPWQVVQSSWSRERFELPYEGEPRVEIKGWFTEDASKKIASLGGQDLDRLRQAALKRDFRPVPLGVQTSMRIENVVQTKDSANVIGKLPGSDPLLSSEAVVYTAHHDHLGMKSDPKPSEDAIYNGALDNASGVAAMLAIGKAFTELPKAPRRSVYFASVTAEEQGLLGSEYLSKHPPIPAGRIAANINIDGVSIFGRTKDLTLIGYGKSSLDPIIVSLAKMQGRVVTPDQFPDRGFFYRSDQFNLARVGVPAAYFDSGTEVIGKPAGWGKKRIEEWEDKDYHQPSDELTSEWDLAGAVEDVRLDFWLGVKVANAVRMPEWNKGDEFESARKKALAEAREPVAGSR
ncbi:MAG TPA: M28 family peptidase [Thermoanaerobaculia bacterium]|nr:M28 family peptidase [Thermoanaerobaculia bacterium]